MNSLKLLFVAAIISNVANVALSQPKPRPVPPQLVRSTLVKVDGTNLVIKANEPKGEAKEITIPTDEHTAISLDGEIVKLQDLTPGVSIITYKLPPSSPNAGDLLVTATSKGIYGTLVKIEGKKLTILTGPKGPQEKEVTVTTDDNTRVRFLRGLDGRHTIEPKDGFIEDLRPGMRVKVVPETGTPQRILVTPPSAPAKK